CRGNPGNTPAKTAIPSERVAAAAHPGPGRPLPRSAIPNRRRKPATGTCRNLPHLCLSRILAETAAELDLGGRCQKFFPASVDSQFPTATFVAIRSLVRRHREAHACPAKLRRHFPPRNGKS